MALGELKGLDFFKRCFVGRKDEDVVNEGMQLFDGGIRGAGEVRLVWGVGLRKEKKKNQDRTRTEGVSLAFPPRRRLVHAFHRPGPTSCCRTIYMLDRVWGRE